MQYREPEDPSEVAHEILRYFLRNPEAADSLEGIARWRLLDERIYRTLEETERALNDLVGQGLLVTEESTALAGRLFRLDPGKLADVERFLQQGKDSPRRREKHSSSRRSRTR